MQLEQYIFTIIHNILLFIQDLESNFTFFQIPLNFKILLVWFPTIILTSGFPTSLTSHAACVLDGIDVCKWLFKRLFKINHILVELREVLDFSITILVAFSWGENNWIRVFKTISMGLVSSLINTQFLIICYWNRRLYNLFFELFNFLMLEIIKCWMLLLDIWTILIQYLSRRRFLSYDFIAYVRHLIIEYIFFVCA